MEQTTSSISNTNLSPGSSSDNSTPGSWTQHPAHDRTVLLGRASWRKMPFQLPVARHNPGRMTDYYETSWGSWLGQGAYGTVRRSKCRKTGLDRAVKCISLSQVEDPRLLQVEISVQRRLHHPNVVRLFETFRTDLKVHLVLELCAGGELFDKISKEAQHGFPEQQAAKYCLDIASALCHIHAQFVAHRDLKPENFLLSNSTPEAVLKLTDFGASRIFEPNGAPMTSQVGTAYYVAPEVLEGSHTELCDVWSAGVISYVLLCGYPPFRGKSLRSILKRVRQGIPSFSGDEWGNVSAEACSFCSALLTRDPAERPDSRSVFSNPWLQEAGRRPDVANLDTRIVEKFQHFEGMNMLKRIAITATAQRLPDEAVDDWRNLFQALDKDGDGAISKEELRDGLSDRGITCTELDRTVDALYSDGSGKLDGSCKLGYTEFLAATLDHRLYLQEDVCMAAFQSLDANGDGSITKHDISLLLTNEASHPPRESKIYELIQEADLNGDGAIDFAEFQQMMKPKTRVSWVAHAAQRSMRRSMRFLHKVESANQQKSVFACVANETLFYLQRFVPCYR